MLSLDAGAVHDPLVRAFAGTNDRENRSGGHGGRQLAVEDAAGGGNELGRWIGELSTQEGLERPTAPEIDDSWETAGHEVGVEGLVADPAGHSGSLEGRQRRNEQLAGRASEEREPVCSKPRHHREVGADENENDGHLLEDPPRGADCPFLRTRGWIAVSVSQLVT